MRMPIPAWRRSLIRRCTALLLGALAMGCGTTTTEPDPGGNDGPTTGSLAVTVTGLPGGASAAVTVAGPGGFSRSLAGTATLSDLAPGTYTVTSTGVASGADSYEPAEATASVTVVAGQTATTTVTYARVPMGTLSLTVGGLPTGMAGDVSVSDGAALDQGVTGSIDLRLPPGDYTVSAAEVTAGPITRAPDAATQSVTVVDAETTIVVVTYSVVLGSLALTVQGLPDGVDGDVTVSGPASFQQVVPATATLTDLEPGEYQIAALDVQGGDYYTADPAAQTLTVASAATSTATVSYARFELLARARTVSAEAFYTCALDASAAVACWGAQDSDGGFGAAGAPATSATSPTGIGGQNVPAFVEIATGRAHQCGLTAENQMYCWGDNTHGQLGDGTYDRRLQPAPVAGGLVVSSIAAGSNTTCAITVSGQAYCWGQNQLGSLGDGQLLSGNEPSMVTGNHLFSQIVVGQQHVCALDDAGWIWCWGGNESGQLGQGWEGSAQSAAPDPVLVDDTGWARLGETRGRHQCALKASGEAYCWGNNQTYQLGRPGVSMAERTRPFLVPEGHRFAEIVGGGGHTCGIDGAGRAWCWGYNGHGELGLDDTKTRAELWEVSGALRFTALILGPTHTCGVTDTGALYCWGENVFGALGDGTVEDRHVPTPVLPIG